jgi:hypothetical protein
VLPETSYCHPRGMLRSGLTVNAHINAILAITLSSIQGIF